MCAGGASNHGEKRKSNVRHIFSYCPEIACVGLVEKLLHYTHNCVDVERADKDEDDGLELLVGQFFITAKRKDEQ